MRSENTHHLFWQQHSRICEEVSSRNFHPFIAEQQLILHLTSPVQVTLCPLDSAAPPEVDHLRFPVWHASSQTELQTPATHNWRANNDVALVLFTRQLTRLQLSTDLVTSTGLAERFWSSARHDRAMSFTDSDCFFFGRIWTIALWLRSTQLNNRLIRDAQLLAHH